MKQNKKTKKPKPRNTKQNPAKYEKPKNTCGACGNPSYRDGLCEACYNTTRGGYYGDEDNTY